MIDIPREQWWLEEIYAKEGLPPGFILVHASRGRDVACRIDSWESAEELREKLACEIVELRELVHQPDIWLKN